MTEKMYFGIKNVEAQPHEYNNYKLHKRIPVEMRQSVGRNVKGERFRQSRNTEKIPTNTNNYV